MDGVEDTLGIDVTLGDDNAVIDCVGVGVSDSVGDILGVPDKLFDGIDVRDGVSDSVGDILDVPDKLSDGIDVLDGVEDIVDVPVIL